MKYKIYLITIMNFSLFFSYNLSAAPFFETVSSKKLQAVQIEIDNLQQRNPSVQDTYVYSINGALLTAQSRLLELNITPGLTLFASQLSASKSASGGLLWKGSLSISTDIANTSPTSYPIDNTIILINREGSITGTIRTDGRLFKIQPLDNNLHLVFEVNQAAMKPDHPPGTMEELNAQSHQQAPLPLEGMRAFEAAPVIRVLVLYSNGVPREVRDIPGLIDLAFAETNQGYRNSAINARVELAHLTSTNYGEVGISTDLNRLKATNDGYMDEAHSLRNQYAADVVMLIVPDNGSACGKAAAIGAVASSAFAVTAQDCATGYYSFGHEIGHLQSARHNPEQDSTNTPYRFGHGYQDPNRGWRTVMSYNCSGGCSRINWWSNPNKTRNGTPMGTSQRSDNARVLNLTSTTVAKFRGDSTNPGDKLENGVPKTGLGAGTGQDITFTMDVPAGSTNINFVSNGGTGDADLYVRFNAAPTDNSYDCRPYLSGNNESCSGTASGGTYHIRLKAYSTFANVTLTGSYQ